jgi:putative toxin-antitoxin system antitoxin component (TIGR02293 family)
MGAEVLYNIDLDREVMAVIRNSKIDEKLHLSKDAITFRHFLTDTILMIAVIREGIPYSFFDKIQDFTPFSESDWAMFLDISTKSLQRYKQSHKTFKPIQSEKIIEMAEVTKVGLEVFSDIEKFKLWLNTPNYALGSITPIELIKDSYGKELVIAELTRIQYGIFV